MPRDESRDAARARHGSGAGAAGTGVSAVAPERSCEATTAEGEPCGAPSAFVDPETGRCPAHSEDGSEEMRERGRRGAEATARRHHRRGMETPAGWTLDSYEDAERWLELCVRGALSGKIDHKQVRAAVKAIEAWMRARDEGEVAGRLDDLADALAEWRRTGDPAPVLELVE